MYTAPVSATISLGQADDLPRVYEDMKLQFPPSELYPYKETLQLLYNNQYKLLLYKRDSDQALLGYALVYIAEDANTVWLDYICLLYTSLQCKASNSADLRPTSGRPCSGRLYTYTPAY